MRDGACCVRVDVSGQGEAFPPDGRFAAADEGHAGVTSDTRHFSSSPRQLRECVRLSEFLFRCVCVWLSLS